MRIDSNIPLQNIKISDVLEVMSKLNVGDVIRAKVLEVVSSDVLLKLIDGTTLSTKAPEELDLKAGQTLDLVVKGKSYNQLVLETVKNENENFLIKATNNEVNKNDINIIKELSKLEVKPDTQNMDVAKSIVKNDLPINKEIFNKVLDTLLKFKDLTPLKAAFLVANSTVVDAKNISALNQLVDNKSKISSELEDIFQAVNDIGDDQAILNIGKQLQNLNSQMTNKPTGELSNELLSYGNTGAVPENPKSNLQEDIVTFLKGALSDFESKEVNVNPEIRDVIEKISDFIKTDKVPGFKISENVSDFLEKEFSKISSEILTKYQISDNNYENADFMKNTLLEIAKKNGNNIFKDVNFELDKANLPEINNVNIEKAKAEIHKSIEKIFVKVDSKNLKDEISVKNLYKEIITKLDIVREGLEPISTQSKSELINKIDNLENNLRFMNIINNNNTYIQIPLNIWDKNTTGELYVLKRDSKRRKIDPNNVTLFISLNTGNLGKVDSLLNVNNKNIGVNIRVENQEIITYLKQNYKELYTMLSEKGYRLVDIKYRLLENEANILNVKEITKKDMQSNKIDYRL